jgi:hypothetical protein
MPMTCLRHLANDRQLVAVITVERGEVIGQLYGRLAPVIGGDVAVVDVQHLWRLDEGMREVLVRRVKRVVNLKTAAPL